MAELIETIAFISGANRGLGLYTARHLGLAGVRVVMGSMNPENGAKAAADLKKQCIKAESVKFDLEQEQDHIALRQYLEKQFGRLDILVNNAGVTLEGNVSELGPHNTVLNVPIETVRKTYEINFFGALRLTRTLLPLLRRAPAARIVNVSSILGSLTLHSDPSKPLVSEYKSFVYGSSKTLLNAFTVYIAHALRGTQIKANSAHPGWTKTDLGGAAAELDPEEGGKNQRATGTAGCKRSHWWLLPPRRAASLVEKRPLPRIDLFNTRGGNYAKFWKPPEKAAPVRQCTSMCPNPHTVRCFNPWRIP